MTPVEVGAAMTIEGIPPHSAVQGRLVMTNPASEQTNGEHVQYVLSLIYLSCVQCTRCVFVKLSYSWTFQLQFMSIDTVTTTVISVLNANIDANIRY